MPKLTLRTNEEMGFCFVKGQIFHLQNSLEKIGFIKTQAGLSLTYDARRKTFRTSHTILRSYASCAAGITSSTYATPTKLTACPSLCAGAQDSIPQYLHLISHAPSPCQCYSPTSVVFVVDMM